MPRHYKVTLSSLELLTMTANGRVQRGHGLSFDASPPDIFLSSIWTGRDSKEFGRFGWDRLEFRGNKQSMLISDWGTYKKLLTYKYRKEHSRVKENGHGFGQKSIGMKIEQGDVMRSKMEWGLAFRVQNGNWGGRHETRRILETWNV